MKLVYDASEIAQIVGNYLLEHGKLPKNINVTVNFKARNNQFFLEIEIPDDVYKKMKVST